METRGSGFWQYLAIFGDGVIAKVERSRVALFAPLMMIIGYERVSGVPNKVSRVRVGDIVWVCAHQDRNGTSRGERMERPCNSRWTVSWFDLSYFRDNSCSFDACTASRCPELRSGKLAPHHNSMRRDAIQIKSIAWRWLGWKRFEVYFIYARAGLAQPIL